MAEIYVKSSSELNDIVAQLRKLNGDFRGKASDINSEHMTLTTKWEGRASTTFSDNFRKEYPNFENFATTIDEYCDALTQIVDEYVQAETTNDAVARD